MEARESRIIVATELQLRAFFADAFDAAFKHHQPPPAETTSSDEVLTIEQAAELLTLTTQTVYGLVSERKIPFCKPTGSRLYFLRSDLIAWLKKHRTDTVEQQIKQYDENRATRAPRTRRSHATSNQSAA